jgi:predicted porin
MKKLLIATAALAMVAGTAQAQSNVQVYGILDLGYSQQKYSADDETLKQNQVNGKSGLSSSRLGFKGTEDLGGGMKAGFVLEMGVTSDTAGNPFSSGSSGTRAANVSLSGNFGELTIGRQNSIGKNMNDNYTAFGGGASFVQGSAVHTVTGIAGGLADDLGFDAALSSEFKPMVDRVSNAVTYTSPNMNGLQISLQVNEKSSDDSTEDGKTQANQSRAIRADYKAGKLSVSAAFTDSKAKEEDPASKSDADLTQFGLSYDFGVAKAFLAHASGDTSQFDGAYQAKTKGTDIGVIVPVSPKVNLLASYGTGDVKYSTDDGFPTSFKVDVDGYMLQAHYALSKRTTAYALYSKTTFDGTLEGESLGTSSDKVTMIGLRHSF